jgi:pimeloyl-ACP methyl ester carboxylesterase
MANDLAEFICDQKLKNVIAMGHSLGGRVLMRMCVKYPDLISKAIVVDIMPQINTLRFAKKIAPAAELQLMLNALLEVDLNKTKDQIKQQVAAIEPNEKTAAFLMTNLVEIGPNQYKWRMNLPSIANSYRQIIEDPVIYPKEKRFTGDVKVIAGAKSPYYREDDMKVFRDIFEKFNVEKDIQVIQNAGHWVHFDKPYEFIDAVSSFLVDDAPKA